MNVILQYYLDPEKQTQVIALPKDASFLHVAKDWGPWIAVWALVDPGRPKEARTFDVLKCEEEVCLGPARDYLGTAVYRLAPHHIFVRL